MGIGQFIIYENGTKRPLFEEVAHEIIKGNLPLMVMNVRDSGMVVQGEGADVRDFIQKYNTGFSAERPYRLRYEANNVVLTAQPV